MTNNANYLILAYYFFSPLKNPLEEVQIHKDFLEKLDATCRIYLSEEGINGQLCISKSDAEKYMEWLRNRPEFAQVKFKIHYYHEHVFPRLTIKYRKQLVAFDADYNLENRGKSVAPQEWKELLESSQEKVVLDVRNDYEWDIGHFEGAEVPPCETFRDFNDYARDLKDKVKPDTAVMMYCTGGIRCEFFSALLKDQGFENVYQLDGGVINYGLQEGSKHWKGKLFVFDDRLAVPISDEKTPIVGKCYHCGKENEDYYNCANMDCNFLFMCCKECLKQYLGCCCEECKQANRLRPYHEQNPHKPFKRWYHYQKSKT